MVTTFDFNDVEKAKGKNHLVLVYMHNADVEKNKGPLALIRYKNPKVKGLYLWIFY